MPRGDHVLDHDDRVARGETPLDTAPEPVAFGFLAYGERVDGAAGSSRGMSDRIGDRVSAEGQTAYGLRCPALLIECGEPEPTDEQLAFAGHRGAAGGEGVNGVVPRWEAEIAAGVGAVREQGEGG